ncbi:MAG TPA: hypothetical protein VGK16_10730 [Candidatus Limnocylindrales bacterium]
MTDQLPPVPILPKASPSLLARVAWHPVLFAAYPVLFLWSQNLGEAGAGDVLPLAVAAAAVAAGATLILGLLFRDLRRAALVVTPVVVGLLMYGHLANLLHPVHVRPILQQAGWVALVVLGVVAAIRLGESRVARLTWVLDRVAAVLVVVVLVQIVPSQLAAMTEAHPEASAAAVPGAPDRPLRDVYYLILDRYGSDRAMSLRFGVTNDLTPWLTQQGFTVLADSNANYVKTTMSLASTLNMTHLVDLAARMGKDNADHAPIFSMLQNTAVARQFKALGYTYLHLGSWYSPTQTDTLADRNLYLGGPSDFAATLYDTSAVPTLLKRLHLSRGKAIDERAYAVNSYAWQALASIRSTAGPKFVFGHILLPHPPYVFNSDGSFVDHESGAKLPESQRLAAQLAWTNTKLREWIEGLLALPEPQRPIIIIQADEGPYPIPYQRNTGTYDWAKATTDELLEKYGILNAWYVPGGVDIGLYSTMSSVNTFPVLFSGYFGLDVPRLEDRSYTSASKVRPYDLTEITDRLAVSP